MKYLLPITIFLVGCFDPTGKEVGVLNAKTGMVQYGTFASKCPLKTSALKEVPLSSLDGQWCMIRAKDCGKITTEYEQKECD